MEIKKSKTYEIIDLINWNNGSELIISPKYQRNPVWDNNAKSFLIDTILRDYPMPPLFYRQTFFLKERKTIREVIDGQQRTRAILDYYNNVFPVLKRHNVEYGGMFFKDLPPEAQEQFLKYNIFVDTISEKDDSIIYDIFARMNSNAANVNKQEIRNAKFWGDFKTYVYDTASKVRDSLIAFGTFTAKGFSRMQDMEFISSLFILAMSGCTTESAAQIDKYYKDYNSNFQNALDIQKVILQAFMLLNDLSEYLEQGCFVLTSKNYMYDLIGLFFASQGIIKVKDINRFSLPPTDMLAIKLSDLNDRLNALKDKNSDKNSIDLEIYNYERDHKVHSNSKESRENRVLFLYNFIEQR